MDSTTLLSQLKTLAAQSSDRIGALQQIADLIRSSGNYRWVGLYDVNHATQIVSNVVFSGPGAPEYPSFPISKGLTGGAITTRGTVNVGNVSSDPRYLTAFGSTQSEIIIPILDQLGERVLGSIDIESEYPNAFDVDTQRALEEYARQISVLWRVGR
jgi:L-methionine (R)-S-oxide reductase